MGERVREWGHLFVHINAGVHVVAHACTVQCVFIKARDPEWERVREWREITKGYSGVYVHNQ